MAVVFIGGAELAACYWLDPLIYHRIMDPVIEKVSALWRLGSDQVLLAVDNVKACIEEYQVTRQEKIESQRAGEPAIPDGGVVIQDPAVTELVVQDQQEILTGGSVSIAYFAQSDPAWKDQPYGSDRIGPYGCGPTVMAMAVKSLTGTDTDPQKMASWCSQNGYWAAGSGSYHSIVQGVANAFGLECTSQGVVSPEKLRTQLSGGRIAVALMSAGHFTSGGHFILLRGVTLDGNILVADPNSRERSLQEWDASIILDELSSSTVAGAPLWFLSEQVQ